MMNLPDLKEMIKTKHLKDITKFYCFNNCNFYDKDYLSKLMKLAKSININPELLQNYNNWLNINNKYFYFKTNYAFQELLIESIFKEIKVNTVEHEIVKFDEEVGIISANYRKPKITYQFFDELAKGLSDKNSFIEINNLIKMAMNKEDYIKYLNQIFKIISVDILFGQYDRWEHNVFFAKSKNRISLAPMFDNGCIFSDDFGDIIIYKSCFGNFSFSERYEDYFTTEILCKHPKLVLCLEEALTINLSKIFNKLERDYELEIYKEIRTQIQNYYDTHRKMVEKTLKFAR